MTRSVAMLEKAKKYLTNHYHFSPVVLAKGEGVWVWDVDGNKYLDGTACYSADSFGHCNEEIIEALMKQAKTMSAMPLSFCHDKLGDLAEALAHLCSMDKVMFKNSGTEAFDAVIKLSRKWWHVKKSTLGIGFPEIIVCTGNFHGRSLGAVSASDVGQYREGFGPFLPGIVFIPFGDPDALGRAITKNTAAFIVEPIQGEGGINVPPDGYFKEVEKICRKKNVLLALDEVQTGFGRTGYNFAFEREGIQPDMLMVAKALGGGLIPVSAVLVKNFVVDGVINPGDEGSTYAGSSLACAVGLKAISVLKEKNLAHNAALLGDYFISELRKIKSGYIKEVRGRGLMIGIEINNAPASKFCEALLKERVLVKETRRNTVRFTPALTITWYEIDGALESMKGAFRRMEK